MTEEQLKTKQKLDEQLAAWGFDKERRERAIKLMYDLRQHNVKLVLSVESENHYLMIDGEYECAI